MRQLNFAAHPHFSHSMREVKRLFGNDFRQPMLKNIREFLEQVMNEDVDNRVQADWCGFRIFLPVISGYSCRFPGRVPV